MKEQQKKQNKKEVNRIEKWECPHMLTYIDPDPPLDEVIRCSKCGEPYYPNPKKRDGDA